MYVYILYMDVKRGFFSYEFIINMLIKFIFRMIDGVLCMIVRDILKVGVVNDVFLIYCMCY